MERRLHLAPMPEALQRPIWQNWAGEAPSRPSAATRQLAVNTAQGHQRSQSSRAAAAAATCVAASLTVGQVQRHRLRHKLRGNKPLVARGSRGGEESEPVAVAVDTERGSEEGSDWWQFARKEDWYSEYDSVNEFGPVNGDVEGTLPAELCGGTFFRNGPGKFERGGQRYKHVIDGDGLVLRISLPQAGEEHFEALARFVRSETFAQEEAEDRICARSAFGTQRKGVHALANVLDTSLKNPANTHIVPWGGKLLALCETGLPYLLDPETLETLGQDDFGGQLRSGPAVTLGDDSLDEALGFGHSVTAHPHVDPELGHLIIWSCRNLAMEGCCRFTVSEFDEQWQEKSVQIVTIPSGIAPHDFAVTKSYYIWVENRMALTGSGMAGYLLGLTGPAENVEADASLPTRMHLLTRKQKRHLQVEMPPWFSIHQSHAEEYQAPDGSTVVSVYSSGWKKEGLTQNGGKFLAAWAGYAPDFDVIPPTFYWRSRIRISPDGTEAALIDHAHCPGMENVCMEHPHVHPHEEGSSGARYAYATRGDKDGLSTPSIGWCRVDLRSGETSTWSTPKQGGCFAQEPVVVPKADSDGAWVLAMLNDHRRNKSCLCVLDGDDFAAGPVCRLWLPYRLPHALHSSFEPAAKA